MAEAFFSEVLQEQPQEPSRASCAAPEAEPETAPAVALPPVSLVEKEAPAPAKVLPTPAARLVPDEPLPPSVPREIPGSYRPAPGEPFMSEGMKEHFRSKLLSWRRDVLKEIEQTAAKLKMSEAEQGDDADRASSMTDRNLELRARERQTKLVEKIDAALRRIEDGDYGYCEETGEPIALARLEARPIATLSVESQERRERAERLHRDDAEIAVF